MCRDDLVQVGKGSSNGTLMVRTVNVGLTLLGVWDSEQTGLADFIALPVQNAIHPAEAQRLVVGDVVCFSAQIINQEGKSEHSHLKNTRQGKTDFIFISAQTEHLHSEFTIFFCKYECHVVIVRCFRCVELIIQCCAGG